jgi:hypothetical protein
VQKSTLKNKTPKSGSVNFPDPDLTTPAPSQATVQKSTLKNKNQESGSVIFPNPDFSISPPFMAAVQKSTVKNNSPTSGSTIQEPDLHSSVVASLPGSTPIDYAQMAALQSTCAECNQMCDSTVLFVVTRKIGGTLLRGDISSNVFRPLVPVPMRTAVISAIHNVAHPGIEATVRLVTAKFCWPKMAKQIRLFAQQCIPCQMAKVSTHVHLTPAAIPVPQRRFEHLHVDLVGPLPPSSGYSYLFTVVDRTTRWPEAIPVSGISSSSVKGLAAREDGRSGLDQSFTLGFVGDPHFCSFGRRTVSGRSCHGLPTPSAGTIFAGGRTAAGGISGRFES